jgi:hypothetical protein
MLHLADDIAITDELRKSAADWISGSLTERFGMWQQSAAATPPWIVSPGFKSRLE